MRTNTGDHSPCGPARKTGLTVVSTVCLLMLGGCYATGADFAAPVQPDSWTRYDLSVMENADVQVLKGWWSRFQDPALSQLVDMALNGSPDRKIAEARILEARGVKRTAFATLFPLVSGSAQAGREKTASINNENFYDAGFDASFELDVFGVNRKANEGAYYDVQSLEASYHDVSLTLVADVVRAVVDYRAAAKQAAIARKNLESQERTMKLIRTRKEVGESTQLDVERSENLVNTTRASIPEFDRQAENARLRLTILTGALPAEISTVLSTQADIPGGSVQPVLMAPAQVLALRPDIRAAQAALSAQTARAESATADLFPMLSLSGFYGVTDSALISSLNIWNVALGAAVNILDFGRIEGQIDAARAREIQTYEAYRATVLTAVVEVETALNDYAHITQRRVSLDNAYQNAERSLALSQQLFREGEISFLDVLDAERTANEAEASLVTAQAAQSESLIRLYKSLGVY